MNEGWDLRKLDSSGEEGRRVGGGLEVGGGVGVEVVGDEGGEEEEGFGLLSSPPSMVPPNAAIPNRPLPMITHFTQSFSGSSLLSPPNLLVYGRLMSSRGPSALPVAAVE